jgi:uncharacterized protein
LHACRNAVIADHHQRNHDQQIIYLQEVNGERQFPIVIGIFEATSIERRIKGVQTPRPLTHDLVVSVIEQLEGEPDSVVINDLREGTYFAELRIRRGGEMIAIDSRPSDAIAIAVTCEPTLPIFVVEEVLAEASGDST